MTLRGWMLAISLALTLVTVQAVYAIATGIANPTVTYRMVLDLVRSAAMIAWVSWVALAAGDRRRKDLQEAERTRQAHQLSEIVGISRNGSIHSLR